VCAKRAPWHVCLAGFEFAVVATGVCPLVLHIPRHPFARIESRVHINLLYQCHTYSLNVQKSSPDIAGDKNALRGVFTHKDVVLHHHISRPVEETTPVFNALATIPFAVYWSKARVWMVDYVAIDQPATTERRVFVSPQPGERR
jgi:hypothetical protein